MVPTASSALAPWRRAEITSVAAYLVPSSVTVDDVRAYYVANFEGKGVLLEQVWRDIWIGIVVERRREAYEELVARVEERTAVNVDSENVARYLGQGVD